MVNRGRTPEATTFLWRNAMKRNAPRIPAIPTQSLLDGLPWIKPINTDVTKTWRKFGWKPVVRKTTKEEA